MFNPKPKTEVKAAFIGEVVAYLEEVSPYKGPELAEFTAKYVASQWGYVNAVYDAGCIVGLNSGASDFTCDFCCKLLANRV